VKVAWSIRFGIKANINVKMDAFAEIPVAKRPAAAFSLSSIQIARATSLSECFDVINSVSRCAENAVEQIDTNKKCTGRKSGSRGHREANDERMREVKRKSEGK
jgi:hypothetical protein